MASLSFFFGLGFEIARTVFSDVLSCSSLIQQYMTSTIKRTFLYRTSESYIADAVKCDEAFGFTEQDSPVT